MGGGKLREVEKALMETRMANARLMEDNESFQLLLSEKTLNGDFSGGLMSGRSDTHERTPSRDGPPAGAGGSLADELQSVNTESDGGGEGENERKLNAEINSLRDQNKALTLYINSIIERLLNHKGLESVLDKTPNLLSGPDAASAKFASREKDLPPVPPPKDSKDNTTGGPGFLARAKSVMVPKARDSSANPSNGRPRPASVIQSLSNPSYQPPSQPSANEDPGTAPSIPITRSQSVRGHAESGHMRRTSDWSHAAVVQNMYRGPPPGPQSPTGLTSPRNSFFGQRVPSGNSVPTIEEHDTDTDSTFAVRNQALAALEGVESGPSHAPTSAPRESSLPRHSSMLRDGPTSRDISTGRESSAAGSEAGDVNPSSPPRSVASSGDRAGPAIMGGNKMRPLRLVQDKHDQDEKEKKTANRASWMGWFNRGKSEDGNAGQT